MRGMTTLISADGNASVAYSNKRGNSQSLGDNERIDWNGYNTQGTSFAVFTRCRFVRPEKGSLAICSKDSFEKIRS